MAQTDALRDAAIIAAKVSPEDLARLFTLPPEKAVAWFRQLGIAVTWDWRADWQEIQEQVFTIAKVTDENLLAAVQSEIGHAIERGVTQRDFRAFLSDRLEAAGWNRPRIVSGAGETAVVDLSAPWRQDVIFRTNSQSALNAGRQLTQLDLADEAPYWQYVAVMDARTRPNHAALHGLVYRFDDPVWKRIYPPCGFNCRCRVRALSQAMVNRRRLTVRSSTTFTLPDGVGPDPGFDRNVLDQGVIAEAALRTRRDGARV